MTLSEMPRTSYYRHVRGMTDYTRRPRNSVAAEHRDTLREVALKRPEAGHRKVCAYAVAWQQFTRGEPGTTRMSCYRVLKADVIQPGRPATHLKGHCQSKVAGLSYSTEDRALGRPELTLLGECSGALELEVVP